MSHCLHSQLVVRAVHAHCLLGHGTLQCIFCGLVVVRERDDRATHAKQHRWMDFAVGVPHGGVAQVRQIHGNQAALLLLHIDILNDALSPHLIKGQLLGDVLGLQLELIVFDCEERSHASA